MPIQNSFIVRATFTLLFTILVFYSLIAAEDFLVPLLMGILFAFLLYPVASFLEKKGVPRILANILSIILGIVVISATVYVIYSQLSVFVGDFPELRQKALRNVRNLENYIASEYGVTVERQDRWLRDGISTFFTSGGQLFQALFSTTASTVAKIGVMPVYVFFLLYYRNKFREFLMRVTPVHGHRKMSKILREISHITKYYMGGISLVVLILCVLNSIGLLIVGIQYAILLGIISAVMNFIPYFGTLIGGAFPLLVALITEESPSYAVGVIILFIIIQFTENNILTPNIVGSNVRINPFFTILTIIIGGLVWGLAGMFIFLPFLAMFKIVCENIEPLQPVSYLLGTQGTEKHAITWDKIKGLFKKDEDSPERRKVS
uniref:AI-2E family transporter n=1 Tax=Roseihalotalea indica TaxID=2867963 RepID=A0AA49GHV8_9BACT|nr:AI-2E family transporter [Tunicatimonas sp. TK19036]